MWIPGDFLISPRKLTAVLAQEAQERGKMSCDNTLCGFFFTRKLVHFV